MYKKALVNFDIRKVDDVMRYIFQKKCNADIYVRWFLLKQYR